MSEQIDFSCDDRERELSLLLNQLVFEVKASAAIIVSEDGELIKLVLTSRSEALTLSALATEMFNRSQDFVSRLEHGYLSRIVSETEEFTFMIHWFGGGLVVLVINKQSANDDENVRFDATPT